MTAPASATARVLVPLEIRGQPPALDAQVFRLSGDTMGTTWSVAFAAPETLRSAPIRAAILRVLGDVIDEMSHWDRHSQLSLFNQAAPGSRFLLQPGFAEVMTAALHIAEASGGAFDPTAFDLVRAWGFGPPGGADADASCDWRRLPWDGEALVQPGRVRLDLSAIAKGHAVDRISRLFDTLGLPHHLIDIGGELRGSGMRPDGAPWWVDVEPPDQACALPPLRIALHGLAIATSGDYRKFRLDADGKRRSHTLDPRSREPIAHGLASVSVVHESAMWADGWSTALMVLGPEAGAAFAETHGLAARLVRRQADGQFSEHLSKALLQLLS